MSKNMDGDFADRLQKAAAHNKVPYSQAAIAAFLGIKNRQTIDPWMSGSIPRGDRIFEYADRFGVNPRWFATGEGDMLGRVMPDGLDAQESDLLSRYRESDPRWQLSLRFLAALATEDQIEIATDVNVIIARIFGKKPRELRPIGDKAMRERLKHSPQGWPPREPAKKVKR